MPTVWQQHAALAREARVWGAASVLAGLGLAAAGGRGGDRRLLHFGLQNAEWGVVNAAIGVLADRLRARRIARLDDPGGPDAVRREHRRLRRLLLLNVGLDAGYVLGGLALLRWRQGHAAAVGASAGIVVQGAVLLVHDSVHTLRLGRPG